MTDNRPDGSDGADQDDLFSDGSDGQNASGSDGGDAGAPPAPADGSQSKDDKRVNDLMGKWQRAEARAKAAEAKLAGVAASGEGTPPALPDEVKGWIEIARGTARTRLYESDPRFAEYGVDPALIDGATPEAMRASADRLKKVVDGMETKVRQRVLAEHGFNPELPAAPGGGSVDFAAMSDEEFRKLVNRSVGR